MGLVISQGPNLYVENMFCGMFKRKQEETRRSEPWFAELSVFSSIIRLEVSTFPNRTEDFGRFSLHRLRLPGPLDSKKKIFPVVPLDLIIQVLVCEDYVWNSEAEYMLLGKCELLHVVLSQGFRIRPIFPLSKNLSVQGSGKSKS